MANLAREIIDGVGYGEPKKELIDGIWYMAPRPDFGHFSIGRNLFRNFDRHLRGKKCQAFFEGLEVHLSKDDIYIPDFMVVCNPDIIKQRGIFGAPDLVVEVLSPRSSKRDKILKFNAYEKHGVKEYWIVDTKNKSIEVYLLKDGKFKADNMYIIYTESEIEEMTDEEKAAIEYKFKASLFDDFTIDIREVFEDIE
ncbi:MAG: Uma2 family endonuclease [Clostridiales bacterium]|jgi:Uma2 family endonuclease|nr:Uma2 family endonuclease [Clostridiales bacterium]